MGNEVPVPTIWKFGIEDRVMITPFLPEKGGFTTMIVKRDLLEKIQLTQAEILEIGLTEQPNGGLRWQKELEVGFELTDLEIKMLKDGAKRLDQNEALTTDLVDLYKKIDKM
jgi:hypothetical protein